MKETNIVLVLLEVKTNGYCMVIKDGYHNALEATKTEDSTYIIIIASFAIAVAFCPMLNNSKRTYKLGKGFILHSTTGW